MRRHFAQTDRRFTRQTGVDHGTPERWQKAQLTLEHTECAGVLAARSLEEHVLDTLQLRGWVLEAERVAGLLFQADFHRAGLEPHCSRSYISVRQEASFSWSDHERSPKEEAAYQRWRAALSAMTLADRDVAISVICHGVWPSGQHLPRLKRALGVLVKLYLKR